jgi:hypothetical protein
MGIPEPTDPEGGPVLPDLPLSVSALAARLCDLLSLSEGLALPWIATADEANQLLALEFGPAEQTFRDIAAWSSRFDGVMQSHVCSLFEDPSRHVTATFTFDGATVSVFAFIPCNPHPGQEDQDDNRY